MSHVSTSHLSPLGVGSFARAKVVGVLTLTFVAGALVGAAVARAYIYGHEPKAAQERAAQSGPGESTAPESQDAGIPPQLLQLRLTPDERAEIRAVVARRQPTADSITESVLPRVRALELTMRQEVMCALTRQQQQRWMDWRKERGLSLVEGEDWLALVKAGMCPLGAAR